MKFECDALITNVGDFLTKDGVRHYYVSAVIMGGSDYPVRFEVSDSTNWELGKQYNISGIVEIFGGGKNQWTKYKATKIIQL